jgi:formamidopyrimidine-DNA glycosylase
MPELPEVETIVRRLRLKLTGKKIKSVQVLYSGVLRGPKKPFIRALTGSIIREIRRKGKFILFDLDSDRTLILHLKMTGQVLVEPRSTLPDSHSHVIFRFFSSNFQMRYRDTRKFGFFALIQEPDTHSLPLLSRLGPDPLEISSPHFIRIIHSKNRTIKSLLLDQSMISGLGNIYVDESLFQAQIHPLTKTGLLSTTQIKNLHHLIKKILQRAITLQGSTLKDYRRPDGFSGGFQKHHQVYNRSGLPCPVCRTPIEKMRVAGRGTHLCPSCQKPQDRHRN